MRSFCYLVVPFRGSVTKEWKTRVKRWAIKTPAVYRVTDHGFLKLKTSEPVCVPRSRWMIVEDRTKHWDENIWTMAMDVWRYARLARRSEAKVIGVLVHYLLNLRGVDETKWFTRMAKARKRLNASRRGTAMVDHGWEIKELRKAGLMK